MDSNKLRAGHKILIDNQPYIVVQYILRQQPRLAAKVITKLKNLLTGTTMEKTFTSGDNIEEADITTIKAQYLYNDGETYYFMDNTSFEQFEFSGEKLGHSTNFLIDNMEVSIMKFNDMPINVELPPTITVTITHAEPGVKGDTATGGTKPATIETGVTVLVPLFINTGDKIVINTESGEYRERAK
jgi:elongation factor P